MKTIIALRVNGRDHEIAVEDRWTLLDVLRDELQLTGTKRGCDIGDCGACTVLMDGVPTFSCLVLARQAAGAEIETVEGVGAGELDALQRAFVEDGAIQCGFCTPGMLMTSRALLRKHPHPTTELVRRELSGNLCRCTGYQKIVDAIMDAADRDSRIGHDPVVESTQSPRESRA